MTRGLLILALLFVGGAAQAHPHAWIDLRVSLLFGADGRLEALQQQWAFDPTYSLLLLEDVAARHPDIELDAALQLMTERMLANLREYDYFTEIALGTQRLEVEDARNAALALRASRLHIQFEIPLEPARPDPTRPLRYAVYDPSYWIEVLHDPDDVIHLDGGHDCMAEIARPRPEPWLITYAGTLNREQRAPIEDLGRSFAEVVSIECAAR